MVPPVPDPSSRLVRAVRAEQEELDRHRARLLSSRETLLAELERIESGIAEVDERRALLRRLAPADAPRREGAATAGPGATGPAGTDAPLATAPLRGPAVRTTAVRAALAHPDRPEALHYRDWYDLVTAAGHRVAGKDPVAVFLTQLGRSPVVRKGTQPGVYELDRGAPRRLRARIAQLHEALRELAAAPDRGDPAAVRARRAQLTTQLGRLERALEVADALLGAGAGAAAA